MSKNYDMAFEYLSDYLADPEGEQREEIISQLKTEGVDVDKFLEEINTVVRKAHQEKLRAQADRERKATRIDPSSLFGDLTRMSREQMLALVQKIQLGEFGLERQQMTAARARNLSVGKLSDEDIRSWLKDIAKVE